MKHGQLPGWWKQLWQYLCCPRQQVVRRATGMWAASMAHYGVTEDPADRDHH